MSLLFLLLLSFNKIKEKLNGFKIKYLIILNSNRMSQLKKSLKK